jgi:hypothetical protein
MTLLLVALFGAVVTVTIWGWLIVPRDRRFPVSLGVPPSVEGSVGKRTGLVLWLSIASFFFAGSVIAASQRAEIGWIGAGLLAFFLLMEIHSIRRLSR